MSCPFLRNTASALPSLLYASQPSGSRTSKSGISTTACTGSPSFSRAFASALQA